METRMYIKIVLLKDILRHNKYSLDNMYSIKHFLSKCFTDKESVFLSLKSDNVSHYFNNKNDVTFDFGHKCGKIFF